MKTLSLSLLALMLGASSLAAQGFGNVTGRVTDRTSGRGVPFAALDLISPSGSVFTVQADSLGRFRITAVTAGTMRMRARGIGFTPASPDTIRIVQGENVVRDFQLDALGRVYLQERGGEVVPRRKP